MKDKDLKYNDVLDKLRKIEPVLDDPEGLTDRIMQRVEQTTVGAKRILALRISGIISGVAASALICLFGYETLKYPVSPVEKNMKTEPSYTSYDLTVLRSYDHLTTVIKRKEAQRARKEQLTASITNNQ